MLKFKTLNLAMVAVFGTAPLMWDLYKGEKNFTTTETIYNKISTTLAGYETLSVSVAAITLIDLSATFSNIWTGLIGTPADGKYTNGPIPVIYTAFKTEMTSLVIDPIITLCTGFKTEMTSLVIDGVPKIWSIKIPIMTVAWVAYFIYQVSKAPNDKNAIEYAIDQAITPIIKKSYLPLEYAIGEAITPLIKKSYAAFGYLTNGIISFINDDATKKAFINVTDWIPKDMMSHSSSYLLVFGVTSMMSFNPFVVISLSLGFGGAWNSFFLETSNDIKSKDYSADFSDNKNVLINTADFSDNKNVLINTADFSDHTAFMNLSKTLQSLLKETDTVGIFSQYKENFFSIDKEHKQSLIKPTSIIDKYFQDISTNEYFKNEEEFLKSNFCKMANDVGNIYYILAQYLKNTSLTDTDILQEKQYTERADSLNADKPAICSLIAQIKTYATQFTKSDYTHACDTEELKSDDLCSNFVRSVLEEDWEAA